MSISFDRTDGTITLVQKHRGAPQCPTCGSYDVMRQTHITRVYYTCRRCGTVFNSPSGW